MSDMIIVGEDAVTTAIIKRLLKDFVPGVRVIREEPIRGGEIKQKILKYNRLAQPDQPVCVLTDLDTYDCPPALIQDWFGKEVINPNLIFRIACDEAETWLMADKQGFSRFFGIQEALLPGTKSLDFRNAENIELRFPYKPSLFLMRELAPQSSHRNLVEQLQPRKSAKKGPEYNTVILPFIDQYWDVKAAMMNSYSLRKSVQRIIEFVQRSPY